MRRYAQDTAVPVAKTRQEIDTLLRAWNADAIRWTDEFRVGRVRVEFTWTHGEAMYHARFDLPLPTEEQLRARALNARTRQVSEVKLRNLRERAGRHEHRVLLLWLKAALNAVEAGLVDPAAVFLSFLVGADGRTVADVAIPKLPALMKGGAGLLLEDRRS